MKKLLMMMLIMAFGSSMMAQMQTVQLNSKKLQFDDGRQLPAEKAFIVTSEADPSVGLVKMQISNNGFEKNKPLYEAHWRRKDNDKGSIAILPNHYKLRNGKNYDFKFVYYRKVTETERQQIKTMLESTAHTLLQGNIVQDEKRYKFLISPADVFTSLNGIIEDGMVNYETKLGTISPNFSGVMENMLRTMSKTKMDLDTAGMMKNDLMTALLNQADNEIEMLTNNYTYVVDDNVIVPDYPVEKTRNTLALNIGYGGVYDKGSASDLSYFSGTYAGVSFPLGNKAFSNRFWNRTSISAGVFLNDFSSSDSIKVSGPVVKRPFYAALGYSIFDYLKLQVGATVLEKTNSLTDSKSVSVHPFVGLSFELNLWLGVGKK